ncbi:MAG TPA: hypothetical protein VFR02_06090 [bacterium]|nr:hypothetical protein [bacterium]
MRVSASVSPWLPWLEPFLPSLVLLGGSASELYHSSLLGRPIPPLLIKEKVFGLEKAGKASGALHEHLVKSGFQKRNERPADAAGPVPAYFRGDLGTLRFVFPQTRAGQTASSGGVAAMPEKGLELLLENPHAVEVKYLDRTYDVRVPQIGRFVLANGLKVRAPKKAGPAEVYQAAMRLILVLDLLAGSEDFEDEALDDLLEIRPPALVRELRDNLKDNGPGSILWESAQRLYLNLYPGAKAVELATWHWKFQKRLSKNITDARSAE